MGKNAVKITEKQLVEITKQAVQNIIEGDGLLYDDELMEYARLWPTNTGINVDMYVDDGGAYKRNRHELWAYVKNGHTQSSPYFRVIVSETPKIQKVQLNLSKNEIEAILRFISINHKLLIDFANGIVNHIDFYNLCKPVFFSYIKDNKTYIKEYSTITPDISGLPTVLWIDEGSHPKHGPRIKFQASGDQATTRDFSSMSISQEPEVFNLPKKCKLSGKDLMKIKSFVIANEKLLLMVMNQEMTYQDFLVNMVKV